MSDLIYKALKDFGFPVVIALALLYFMNEQRKEAVEERAQHTAVLIDQLSDLREKVDRMERCK